MSQLSEFDVSCPLKRGSQHIFIHFHYMLGRFHNSLLITWSSLDLPFYFFQLSAGIASTRFSSRMIKVDRVSPSAFLSISSILAMVLRVPNPLIGLTHLFSLSPLETILAARHFSRNSLWCSTLSILISNFCVLFKSTDIQVFQWPKALLQWYKCLKDAIIHVCVWPLALLHPYHMIPACIMWDLVLA